MNWSPNGTQGSYLVSPYLTNNSGANIELSYNFTHNGELTIDAYALYGEDD